MKKISLLLVVMVLIASLVSCGEKRDANRKNGTDVQGDVLATVNGVPITEADRRQIVRRMGGHGMGITPGTAGNVLETVVRDELIYQKSLEIGLDKNPEYRKKLHEVEAQVKAFQRQEMSTLYREYTRNQAKVTDSEAQEYFEKNSKRIQTKIHVGQIYYRGDESQITKDYNDLKSGMPFEKVAARRFPNLPKGMEAPWDLGYLSWHQIPPPWQGSLDRLDPGQVSDIIKGPNARFWVIKVVNKTVDPKITFASEKEKIVEVLQKQKADEFYESTLNQMRAKSKIVFTK